VSNTFDWMSDDDVRQITLLVESLDRSSFDFLQISVGDLKVTIGAGDAAPDEGATRSAPVAAPPPPSAPPPAPAGTEVGGAPDEPDGTVAIKAPMMGRFYAQPEPGAAPFVSLGDAVSADTTVGLIEVMKVFTAVSAGVSGVITEIRVPEAELIEYGQVLFLVRPDGAATEGGG
jgi:acetyl-CoA carboxylase biotin carboxyl carrier protein